MTDLAPAGETGVRGRRKRSALTIVKSLGACALVLAAVSFCTATAVKHAIAHFQRKSAIEYISDISAPHRVLSATHDGRGTKGISVFLQGTDVGDHELQYVASIPDIQTLDLTGTHVTSSGLEACSSFTLLRQLQLAKTNIDSSVWPYLLHQKELTMVDMSDTQVGAKTPTTLGSKQSQLRILLLDRTSLDDERLKWVCGSFPNLEVLSVAGTKVTNQAGTFLERLSQLRDLDLRKTAVDYGIFDGFSSEFLSQMDVIRLEDTAISKPNIELLRQSYPRLRIQTTNRNK